jgi:hypothetical protein
MTDAKTVLDAHEHLVTSLRADPKHGGGVSWTEGVTIIALYDALASTLDRAERAEARVEAARLLAFQMQQAAAAIQGDPDKANAVSSAWVIDVAGRLLAALAAAGGSR